MDIAKLLYIDVPFFKGIGGDMNRSRFLWRTLSQAFDCDILLIERPGKEDPNAVADHQGIGAARVTTLQAQRARGLAPRSIDAFSIQSEDVFRRLFSETDYAYLVIRSTAPSALAVIVEKVSPNTKIIVDSDLVLSRFTAGVWRQNKSLRNRYFFFESLRLRLFEKSLYRKPYLFFLANPEDQKHLEQACLRGKAASRFAILPNAIDFPEAPPSPSRECRYILFFGALDAPPNIDSFVYLMNEIYPRIANKLKQSGVKLFVAGRNEQPLYRELIDTHHAREEVTILGAVDDMARTVAESLFVTFPVQNGTGTRVRVLEAAKARRTVVTTSKGAEGYELGDGALFVRDAADTFAEAIINLIDDPDLARTMGQCLYENAHTLYSEETVARNLVQTISRYTRSTYQIAFVANRFFPEVGGAETNIFYQARELARNGCQVTVYTPRRTPNVKHETMDHVRVHRLWNLLNPFSRFPYLLPRAFCPGLTLCLLRERYDVVIAFPGIHFNTNLACWIQKLWFKKPFMLVCFDFRDYVALIRNQGKVTDMLADFEPSPREKQVLKHSDHIFAISEKEVAFIKRYQARVSYAPVPVLAEEYAEETRPLPFASYHIPEDCFLFLCLGRISHIKGQDIALRAFDEALPQMVNAHCVFVGRDDYEPAFTRELRDYIDGSNLRDRVTLTGAVPREEVLAWLRHATVHVIPVRFMNSGAVVVETWASKTPMIQSDAVDPNLVIDGVNGYLFPSEDVAGLARSMIRAYQEAERLPVMARAGWQLVQEKYTYTHLTRLYLEKIHELVHARSSSSD